MKTGEVIIDNKGSGKRPAKDICRYLAGFASQHGDIRLGYQYDNDWLMYAPPGYLWKANCSSQRIIRSLQGTRNIVEAGLVRKSVVTKWNKRFKALRDLPLKVRGLRKYDINVVSAGVYFVILHLLKRRKMRAWGAQERSS
jgi:hypothetical protein